MWNEPLKAFGVVHIIAFIIAIAMLEVGALLGKKFKYEKYGKKVTWALGIVGLVLLALELFKQIFNAVTVGFTWAKLPLQICSLDMYVLLIVPFIKNDKLRKSFIGITSFVSLSAAVFYFVKPTAALQTNYIIMSFHSFLWHWILIGVGAFNMVSFDLNKKESWKSCLGSCGVFSILAVIMMILNIICNAINVDVEYFYINPNKPTVYPLLNLIFKPDPKPYAVYFIVFLIYFSLGSFIFYGLAILQRYICEKINTKKQASR